MQGDQELAMQAALMCIWGGCRSGGGGSGVGDDDGDTS